MTSAHLPRYLTIRAVADQLGVSVQAVHDRVANGKLHTITRGKRKYVVLASLAKWKLERQQRAHALLNDVPLGAQQEAK